MTQIPVLIGVVPTPDARGRLAEGPADPAAAAFPTTRAGAAWAAAWAQSVPTGGAQTAASGDTATAPMPAAGYSGPAPAPAQPAGADASAMLVPTVWPGSADLQGVLTVDASSGSSGVETDGSVTPENPDRGVPGAETGAALAAPEATLRDGTGGRLPGTEAVLAVPVAATAPEGLLRGSPPPPVPAPVASTATPSPGLRVGTDLRADLSRKPAGETAVQGPASGLRMQDTPGIGPGGPASRGAPKVAAPPEGASRASMTETPAGDAAAAPGTGKAPVPGAASGPVAAATAADDRSRAAAPLPGALPPAQSTPPDPALSGPAVSGPDGRIGRSVRGDVEAARVGSPWTGERSAADPVLPKAGGPGEGPSVADAQGSGARTGAVAAGGPAAAQEGGPSVERAGPPIAAAGPPPGIVARPATPGADTGAAAPVPAVLPLPEGLSWTSAAPGSRASPRTGLRDGSPVAPDGPPQAVGLTALAAISSTPPGAVARPPEGLPVVLPETPRAARMRAVAAADPATATAPPVAAQAMVPVVPGLRAERPDALQSRLTGALSELSADAGLFRTDSPLGVASTLQDMPGSTPTTARHPAASGDAPDPRAIAAQLGDAFVSALPDGAVEITLRPEELGRMRMVLSPDAGGMTVTLMAERPETLDQMRRAIDTLAADLRDLGYAGLNFRFDRSGSGGREGRSAPERAPLTEIAPVAAAERAAAGMAAGLSVRTAARLDIRL